MENTPPIIDTGAAPALENTTPGFVPDQSPDNFVSVPAEPKKKPNIAAIIFAFLFVAATAGAGFLFYMYTNANNEKVSLEAKVKNLNSEISTLNEKITEFETAVSDTDDDYSWLDDYIDERVAEDEETYTDAEIQATKDVFVCLIKAGIDLTADNIDEFANSDSEESTLSEEDAMALFACTLQASLEYYSDDTTADTTDTTNTTDATNTTAE